jgi:hypothetical protein
LACANLRGALLTWQAPAGVPVRRAGLLDGAGAGAALAERDQAVQHLGPGVLQRIVRGAGIAAGGAPGGVRGGGEGDPGGVQPGGGAGDQDAQGRVGPLSADEQLARGGGELFDAPVDSDSHEVSHLLLAVVVTMRQQTLADTRG